MYRRVRSIGIYFPCPICARCETGARTLLTHPDSVVCPYIRCLRDGRCGKFRPMPAPGRRYTGLRRDIPLP